MNKYDLKIIGCSGVISPVNDFFSQINEFADKYGVRIQLFDASIVFGNDHIISAFKHAIRARKQETMITQSLEMELLLYASGERQIKHAIKKMGIKRKNNNFVIVFLITDKISDKIDNVIDTFLHSFNLKRDDSVLKPKETSLHHFGITEEMIAAVNDDQIFQLVLEKIALVDILK